MSKLFEIYCLSVDETDGVLMEFLSTLLEKRTGMSWQVNINNDQMSQFNRGIAIIDIDNDMGRKQFDQMTTALNRVVCVALTGNRSSIKTDYYLDKPIRSADFIDICQEIVQDHPDIASDKATQEEALSQNVKKIEGNEAVNQASYKVNIKRPSVTRLYDLLVDPQFSSRAPFEIKANVLSVVIDPSEQCFYCEHKIILLSMLFKADIKSMDIHDIDAAELKQVAASTNKGSLSHLIWYSTTMGSCGELIKTLPEDNNFKLKRWPGEIAPSQLPRHLISDFMKLAGYMTRKPATIGQIIKDTGVKTENVINFINACSLLNFIDMSAPSSNEDGVKVDSVKRSLFGSIRSKFGIESS